MNSCSRYSDALKLIVDLLDGEITADELYEVRLSANQKGLIRPEVSTLTVITGEHTSIKPEEVQKLSHKLLKEMPQIVHVRTAVVASDPIATALVMLFIRERTRQEIKVFSTLSAASSWLDIEPDELIKEFPDLPEFATFG